jgi:quinoprotein glucose dehydrogenase
MTYTVNGRQYVAIAAGGNAQVGTPIGDYIVAFALP